MAGTYWLTVLPDTSKLKSAINASMQGVKIKADFGVDKQQAQKAGQEAAKTAEQAASKSKPKVKPEADKPASKKAGEQAAEEAAKPVEQKRPKVKPQADLPGSRKVGEDAGAAVGNGLMSSLKMLGPLLGGAAVFGGLKSAISDGMAFTENLNVMQGVTSATGAQIAQVSELAMKLGTDVSLAGVNANDAAAAMTELAKGGMSVDQSMAAVRGSLALAGAAGLEAGQAAMIQSDALHTFRLEASEASRVADLLTNAANASSSDVPQMAQALAQAGSAAAGFKIPIEDTLTSLAMFSNFGIKGSDAGTLMKTSLLSITDGGKPATEAINALGLKLYDLDGTITGTVGKFVGYPAMLDQVAQASQRMTDEQFQAATAVLFGSDAMRGAMIAANGGAEAFKTTADLVQNGAGAVAMSATRMQGLPGAWAGFQNTLDGVKMSVYNMVKGPLEDLLRSLTGLPDFVSRNSGAFKIAAGVITTLLVPALTLWIATQARALAVSVIGGITSMVAAWGTIAGAIASATAAAATYVIVIARTVAASVLAGLSTMVAAFRNLAIGTRLAAAAQAAFNIVLMANPIGLIIAAVVAVGVALWAFFTKTEVGRQMWDKIWTSIKAVAGAVFEFLKSALQFVGDKISWLWQNIAQPAFEGIGAAISTMWNGAKVIWDSFTTVLGKVGDKVGAFKDTLVKAFNAVKDVVSAVWDKIGGVLDRIGDGIQRIKDAGGAVLNAIGLGGNAAGGVANGPGYASGGRINGPGGATSDSILGYPAMVRVSNGEYVVNAASTAKYLPLLHALNSGSLPGFADGGLTPHATEMKRTISQMFGISNIGGYREPDGYNEHSTGNALDVMIPNSSTDQGKALGDSVTAWALKNARAIGLTGAIWRQTSYGYGGGFNGNGKEMPDRGSPTANHFDHVHLFMNDRPDTALSLSGATSVSSSLGSATSASGGSYRAATSSELSASSNRVGSANKAVTQAQQRVDDRTFTRDRAQTRLDAARAAGKDTTDEEQSLSRANRELADANTNLAEKRDKAAEVESADNDLRTNGKLDTSAAATDAESKKSGPGGLDGGSLGQTFVGGLLESIGLDGSLFSNPLEWPSVKSLMAGVNFAGGLLANATGAGGEAGTAGTGGFAGGAANAVGLGGLLSAIPNASSVLDAQSGSPQLAPGQFNPGVAGGTAGSAGGSMSAFAPHGGGAGAAPGPAVDNSININGNVGMSPNDVQTKLRTEQNSRTRTTVMH